MSSIFAPELWDAIIDGLSISGTHKDLMACTLVCRGFVRRSQSHLFSSMRIVGEREPTDHDLRRTDRLTGLIESSSSIFSHVQLLEISAKEPCLAILARLQWRRLKHLFFHNVEQAENSRGVFENINMLVGLPSVQQLTLKFSGSRLLSFSHLHAILSHCNPDMHSLSIIYHRRPKASSPLPLPHPARPPLRIRKLHIFWSPGFIPYFAEPACCLDLIGLEDFSYTDQFLPGRDIIKFAPLLKPARETIQCLRISDLNHTPNDLDPMLLPMLKHVECFDFGASQARAASVALLSKVGKDNRIETITLRLRGATLRLRGAEGFDSGAWKARAQFVEQLWLLGKLPTLRKVVVEIFTVFEQQRYDPRSRSHHAAIVEDALPRFHEKGMLVVPVGI